MAGPAAVFAAAAGVVALVALMLVSLRAPGPPDAQLPAGFGETASLAQLLFTRYVLPFELTSLLLLVAIVGAVALARRRG
jgi:NADH-quinone oxidoreductase subunit J